MGIALLSGESTAVLTVRLNHPHMVMRPFVLDLTKRSGCVSGKGGSPAHANSANRWHSHSARASSDFTPSPFTHHPRRQLIPRVPQALERALCWHPTTVYQRLRNPCPLALAGSVRALEFLVPRREYYRRKKYWLRRICFGRPTHLATTSRQRCLDETKTTPDIVTIRPRPLPAREHIYYEFG